MWNAGDIASVWLDVDDASARTATTEISALADKSGNSHGVTASSGLTPALTVDGLNSALDVATFDGSNDYMIGNKSCTLTAQSTFVIFKYTGGDWGRIFTQSSGGNDYEESGHYLPIIRDAATDQFGSYVDGSVKAKITVPSNTWVLFSSIHNGSTVSNRVNGGTEVTASHTLNRSFTKFMIGGAGVTTSYIAGGIAKSVSLDYAVDETTRQMIEGWLLWECKMEASIPSGHLYENYAPQEEIIGSGFIAGLLDALYGDGSVITVCNGNIITSLDTITGVGTNPYIGHVNFTDKNDVITSSGTSTIGGSGRVFDKLNIINGTGGGTGRVISLVDSVVGFGTSWLIGNGFLVDKKDVVNGRGYVGSFGVGNIVNKLDRINGKGGRSLYSAPIKYDKYFKCHKIDTSIHGSGSIVESLNIIQGIGL